MKLLAQSLQIGDHYLINDPAGFRFASSNLGQIISQALPYIFAAAGIGLLLMIIWSGYTMMLSAGDPKKLAKGRSQLTNAIIGFILVFAAYWIVQILGLVFGWQQIPNIFGG